jgi:type IV secretory pathway TrbF-like protein
MRPEVHIAILKTLTKTKPELPPGTTFPVSEVVQLDVNGTVQTGKATTVTPHFKPPVIEALAILISEMEPEEQIDVLDEFESAMKKMIRLGDKVEQKYAPQISLVKDRVERVQQSYQKKVEPRQRRGNTTVAVEVKEILV